MKYKLENGKTVNIPDKEIENLKTSLELSEKDAIELWLCDNDYETDENQQELDEKAKKVKINHEIAPAKSKKERKPPIKKVSDEKKQLFDEILSDLEDVYRENVQVLTENKLIQVKIGDKTFKIDVIEKRQPKAHD